MRSDNDIPLTGGEYRWFEDSEDLYTALAEDIVNGEFTMTTMFTVKHHPEYPAVIPVILEDGKNVPEDLMAVDNVAQAKIVVWACYGADSVFVPKRIFQEEIEARSFHTFEMIRLLEECDEWSIDLSSYVVYGAPMRPMSASWARIDGAVYIPTSKSQAGYHTYVVVPEPLDKEVAKNYELTFVSRPSAK